MDYSAKLAITIVGLTLLAASCASGLSTGARAEALRMCAAYQQRVASASHGSGEALCTSVVDIADAEGCDLDATIRYLAASFDTRPHRIRHEEVWFSFHPVEDPAVVLQDC
jgi:hypothetical protein